MEYQMSKEWLRQARKQAELTQNQLADKSGVSVSAIRNIEQGQRKGTSQTWEKLRSVLEPTQQGELKKIRLIKFNPMEFDLDEKIKCKTSYIAKKINANENDFLSLSDVLAVAIIEFEEFKNTLDNETKSEYILCERRIYEIIEDVTCYCEMMK